MSRSVWFLAVAVLALGLGGAPAGAQTVAPGDDGPALTVTDGLTQTQVVQDLQNAQNQGPDPFKTELDFYRSLGLIVFTTPFNEKDGLGDGPFDPDESGTPIDLGSRPTLQGNGQFLRVNGLDSQSCNECHSIVSDATVPPDLGIGGVGGVSANAIIMPSLIDVADSFDDRVHFVAGHDPNLPLTEDGVADFNGRFANSPFLFGGGGVELVAKEMTRELEKILADLKAGPGGVTVALRRQGRPLRHRHQARKREDRARPPRDRLPSRSSEAAERRTTDRRPPLRPQGRPLQHARLRPRRDGVPLRDPAGRGPDPRERGRRSATASPNELTVPEMTVLDLFNVTNPPPVQAPDADSRGRTLFTQIGCADCHRPTFATESPNLTLSFPEVAEDPDANVFISIDLRRFGFAQDPDGPGVLVPLYSDLKRHDMGEGLEEDFDALRRTVSNREFVTARLWGIADTGPYLHDGRATSIYQAIVRHGGEAAHAESAFEDLSATDKRHLISFLKSLHTPAHPNEDITP